MKIKPIKLFLISLTLLVTVSPVFAFKLKLGDLLFHDLNCGQLCNAITAVTQGYDHTDISHVAIVVRTGRQSEVIEAIGKTVHATPLNKFLNRSLDKQGRPRVMVGRLTKPYQFLIPQVINYVKAWVGDPYNYSFTPNNHYQSFYCSQLIYAAFKLANHNHAIFLRDKMNFQDPKTGKYLPSWQHYFTSIHQSIPQGEWGTNPGALSRMSNIKIVYFYGKLRGAKHA